MNNPIHIPVLYEDEWCIAVNKPNHMLIHESYYARNITDPTLLQLLGDQLGYQVHPIHRLDRKTSGIMVLVKSNTFMKEFQQLFISQHVHKTYYAVVRGFSNPTGMVNTPVKNDDTDIYKDALTEYETMQQIELDIPVTPYDKSRYSLIKLMPKTGRMHQLRKHMNKINHPIVGDYKYGDRFHNRMFETEFNWYNLFLHAKSIAFTHPFTKEIMELTASFPDSWMELAKRFNWKMP